MSQEDISSRDTRRNSSCDTRGTLRDSGTESVGYIGGTTGGSPRESGAESVGYIRGTTGGRRRETGAESVGYIGEVIEEEKEERRMSL